MAASLARNDVKYKGVRRTPNGTYEAVLRSGGTLHHIGRHGTSEEAARAYDSEAKRRFGEAAVLNFINGELNPLRLRRTRPETASMYTGVFYCVTRGKFMAQAQGRQGGNRKYLGTFATEVEAAKAYDSYMKKVKPTWGRLNFLEDGSLNPHRHYTWDRRGGGQADAPQVQTGAATAGESSEAEEDQQQKGQQEEEEEDEEGTGTKRRKLNEDAIIDLTDGPGVTQTATHVPVRAAVAPRRGRSSVQAASCVAASAASSGRRQVATADRGDADAPALPQPLPAQPMPSSSSPARVKVEAAPAVPAPAPLPTVNGSQAAAADGLKMTLSEAINMLVLEAARRLDVCEEGSEQMESLERLQELLVQLRREARRSATSSSSSSSSSSAPSRSSTADLQAFLLASVCPKYTSEELKAHQQRLDDVMEITIRSAMSQPEEAEEVPIPAGNPGDSDEGEGGEDEDNEEVQTATDAVADTVNNHSQRVRSPRELALQEEEGKIRETKMQARNAISEFESHRRGYFGPMIHSNVTHWHAFSATLARSNLENDRVLEFVNKRLQVDAKYAEALMELPMVDLKGQGGWRNAKPTTGVRMSAGLSSRQLNPTALQQASRCGVPAMDELVTSATEGVGAKVQNFVNHAKATIVDDKLKPMVQLFKVTSEEILTEGQISLENIAKAEKGVQQAYTQYAKAAEHLSPGAEASSAVTGVGLAGSNDLWLADMNYRVAVELQQNIWRESQERLYALFGRMKQLELSRRQTLHSVVLHLVQAQGEVWSQLPIIANATSLRISELKTDPTQVEAEIGEEIRSGAKAEQARQLQQEAPPAGLARKGSLSGAAFTSPARRASKEPPTLSPGVAPGSPPPPSNEPFTKSLKSPLDVKLVKRVELLEHRVTTGLESMPLMRRWRLALVVLTVDDFIHVFDLPPEESGVTDVGAAFKALMPNPLDAKGKFKKNRDAERVCPSVSLLVHASTAKHKPEEGSEAFDVVEKVSNAGFVKVFRAHEVTRVTLKGRSQDQMVDWCCAINGQRPTSP